MKLRRTINSDSLGKHETKKNSKQNILSGTRKIVSMSDKKKKLNTIFPRVTFSLISRTASLFAGNTYRFRLTRYILYPAADRVSLRENIYNTVHFPRNFFPLTS